MVRILGLDLGVASVGSALIDWSETEARGTVVHLGVRIFPEGRDEKKKEPRNKERRTKRLVRRTLRRRRLRRRLLAEALAKAKLLPEFSKDPDSDWAALMYQRRGSRHERMEADRQLDPYLLRKRALSERLEPLDLGRALYHLAKRRGFRGRDIVEDDDRDDAPDDDERSGAEGAIIEEIKGLRAQLAGRTFGAFLADRPQGERKRGRHFHRDMTEEEFEAIWTAQAVHHPGILTAELKKTLKEKIIFFQRPTFWRLATLGKCRFSPGAPLAAKGSWLGQQYVMLEQLNKLRIAGGNARPLAEDERAKILDLIRARQNVTFGAIRKALKPLWIARGENLNQIFNLEGSLNGIKGNAVEAHLSRIFGESWSQLPARDAIRATLHERLFSADTVAVGNKRIELRRNRERATHRKLAAEAMRRDWGISEEHAHALAALEVPTGWLRVSTMAIQAMMPELERGVGVGELTMSPSYQAWRDKHFPHMERPTGEILDRLPSRPQALGDVRNPTVTRTLNEVRKVVNNLLRTYGKPDLIRVELARDLKRNRKERLAIDVANRARERERKKAKAELAKRGLLEASPRDIDKWLLWQECNELCPFTGRKIGFDALFRTGEFDIEHIWPRSRSLDNSFMNKTLCESEFNRVRKGKLTPWELFGNNEEELHQLRKRLETCFGRDKNHPKIRRFLTNRIADAAADPEGFSARQLVDTRYAAVQVRDFLKRLYPDDGSVPPVETCNGAITAQLRDAWGLNRVLNPTEGRKTREDHRHHAIDALAVACTTKAFVKRLSDWHAARFAGTRPPLPKPWPSFDIEAKTRVEAIVVSYRTDRKLSGGFHEDMPLGATTRLDQNGRRFYVKRKPVHELSDGEVERIVDCQIRALVQQHAPTEAERKKLKDNPLYMSPTGAKSMEAGKHPAIHKVRIQQAYADNAGIPLPVIKALATFGPGSLRHLAIYRTREGALEYRTETKLQAIANLRQHGSSVRRQLENGSQLAFSLSANDILERVHPSGKREYFLVRKVNQQGRIFYKEATSALAPKPEVSFGVSQFRDGSLRKVSVDPIGRVRPAHD